MRCVSFEPNGRQGMSGRTEVLLVKDLIKGQCQPISSFELPQWGEKLFS